jgi:hypothetical protein
MRQDAGTPSLLVTVLTSFQEQSFGGQLNARVPKFRPRPSTFLYEAINQWKINENGRNLAKIIQNSTKLLNRALK